MITKFLGECTNIQKLLDGGQKEVCSAHHPSYGKIVIKIGKYSSLSTLERMKREVGFLKSTKSLFYPQNYDFIVENNGNRFLIVEEYIKTIKITDVKQFFLHSEQRIILLMKELINALSLLWDNNIVHRDIKPDNVLFKDYFQPVIIDLGIARFTDLASITNTFAHLGPCTPIFASPEQLLNKKREIDMRTDFFGIGMMLLIFYLGFHPFDPTIVGNRKSIPENIIAGTYVGAESVPGTSQSFVSLLRKMLQVKAYIKTYWR